jgi:hypothetical protein
MAKRTIYISDGTKLEPHEWHYAIWDNMGEDWKHNPYQLAEVNNASPNLGFRHWKTFSTIKGAKAYCQLTFGEPATRER